MRRKELVVRLGVFREVLTPKDMKELREVLEILPRARRKPSYANVVRLVLEDDDDDGRKLRRYVSYLHKVMRGMIDPEKIRKRENLDFLKKVLEVMESYEPEYAKYLSNYIERAERFNPWMR